MESGRTIGASLEWTHRRALQARRTVKRFATRCNVRGVPLTPDCRISSDRTHPISSVRDHLRRLFGRRARVWQWSADVEICRVYVVFGGNRAQGWVEIAALRASYATDFPAAAIKAVFSGCWAVVTGLLALRAATFVGTTKETAAWRFGA
jgi:hypothetical protein